MAERTPVAKKTEAKTEAPSSRVQKAEHPLSMNPPVEQILFLQRTAGNQAVQRLIKSGSLQSKSNVSKPGYNYEQEAGRVSEQVIRVSDSVLQRKCSKCEDDEKILQAKELPGQVLTNHDQDVPSIVHEVLRSPGQQLDPATRSFMEPRLGMISARCACIRMRRRRSQLGRLMR